MVSGLHYEFLHCAYYRFSRSSCPRRMGSRYCVTDVPPMEEILEYWGHRIGRHSLQVISTHCTRFSCVVFIPHVGRCMQQLRCSKSSLADTLVQNFSSRDIHQSQGRHATCDCIFNYWMSDTHDNIVYVFIL